MKPGIKHFKVPFGLNEMLKFNPQERVARDTNLERSNEA